MSATIMDSNFNLDAVVFQSSYKPMLKCGKKIELIKLKLFFYKVLFWSTRQSVHVPCILCQRPMRENKHGLQTSSAQKGMRSYNVVDKLPLNFTPIRSCMWDMSTHLF